MSKEMQTFLKKFQVDFDNYIGKNLNKFLREKYSEIYHTYKDKHFNKIQFKLENRYDFFQYLYNKCEKEEKFNSDNPDLFEKLRKIKPKDEFVPFLNIKQVEIKEKSRKKGYFKNMILYVENICKKNNINLIISQILNEDFWNMLGKKEEGKASYTITKENRDVNAVKIFQIYEETTEISEPPSKKQKISDGKKSKKRSKSKRKSKSKKRSKKLRI